MIFSLLVISHPDSEASSQAYHFAEAVVNGGHQLYRVFFYQDGVFNAANAENSMGSISLRWQQLALIHHTELAVCSTAATKRGIIDNNTTAKDPQERFRLLSGFTLSGLGQLADAAVNSDRLVTFG